MRKIEYDETKEYSLEEMKAIAIEARLIQTHISDRIEFEEIKEYDFTNKFVFSKDYGYMFVTWQRLDAGPSGYSEMFFQGIGINACLSEYLDSNYLKYDAMEEWRIPLRTFRADIERGDFVEISKEVFLKRAKDDCDDLFGSINAMVERIERVNRISKSSE